MIMLKMLFFLTRPTGRDTRQKYILTDCLAKTFQGNMSAISIRHWIMAMRFCYRYLTGKL